MQNQPTFCFVAPTKIWGTLHLLSPMEYTHGFALMAELPKADQGKRPEPLAMEFEKENEKSSFCLLIRFLNGNKLISKKMGNHFLRTPRQSCSCMERRLPSPVIAHWGGKAGPFRHGWMPPERQVNQDALRVHFTAASLFQSTIRRSTDSPVLYQLPHVSTGTPIFAKWYQ